MDPPESELFERFTNAPLRRGTFSSRELQTPCKLQAVTHSARVLFPDILQVANLAENIFEILKNFHRILDLTEPIRFLSGTFSQQNKSKLEKSQKMP